jgi:hypothetical protein
MARGDTLYCRVEVDFLQSHEWNTLNQTTRCLYLYLWSYAVQIRQESFPLPSNSQLGGRAGVAPQWVGRSLQTLCNTYYQGSAEPLLIIEKKQSVKKINTELRLLRVPGVQRKHAKLKGWADPYVPLKGLREREYKEDILDKSKISTAMPYFSNLYEKIKALHKQKFPSLDARDFYKFAARNPTAPDAAILSALEYGAGVAMQTGATGLDWAAATRRLRKPRNDEMAQEHRERVGDGECPEWLAEMIEEAE